MACVCPVVGGACLCTVQGIVKGYEEDNFWLVLDNGSIVGKKSSLQEA